MGNFDCEFGGKNIFSGDDYDEISGILRKEFKDYADSINMFWRRTLEEDNVANVTNNVNDAKEREESFKRVLEETFNPAPGYTLYIEKYVQGNLGYLKSNPSNIDEDQKNVLKGWMLWDFMHKMEDIREIQSNMGEEVEDCWIPNPSLEIGEISDLYSSLLRRWTIMQNR